MPFEVQVLHDRDVVLTELFQEEWMAEKWARAYAGGLKELGFREIVELPHQEDWLPLSWFRGFKALVALR